MQTVSNLHLYITRLKDDSNHTISECSLHSDRLTLFRFSALELSYKNNERNISCIPHGKYKGRVRVSKKYGRNIHILNVDDRSFILVHSGNYKTQTKGCVLVGSGFKDINNDGSVDVINSKDTMSRLMSFISDNDDIEIIITPPIICHK